MIPGDPVPMPPYSWRSLRMEEDRVLMNWPENYEKRSQDLPPAFHDCGQFYWLRVDRFLKVRRVFTENCVERLNCPPPGFRTSTRKMIGVSAS